MRRDSRKDSIQTARPSRGKRRTRNNALKHGIFAQEIVLEGESRAAFDSIWNGLRECRQPQGFLEEVLVEQLATLLWRLKRTLRADSAEVEKRTQFIEWDEEIHTKRQAEEIGMMTSADNPAGLISNVSNPEVLGSCLLLLTRLKAGIQAKGFIDGRDSEILERLYGPRYNERLRRSLYDHYAFFAAAARSTEDQPSPNYRTPSRCREEFLECVDDEMEQLRRYRKDCEFIETKRMQLEIRRLCIPEGLGLERVARYETHLSRQFDRTLRQLDHCQRVRQGQPLPATVNVEVTRG